MWAKGTSLGVAAGQCGEHCNTGINVLAFAGDDPLFDEPEYARGRHLRMPAQVPLLIEGPETRQIGARGADPDLDGIPIPDQLSHVLCYLPVFLARLLRVSQEPGELLYLFEGAAEQIGQIFVPGASTQQGRQPLQLRSNQGVLHVGDHLLRFFDRQLGTRVLDEAIDFRDVYVVVPIGADESVVHLCKDYPSVFGKAPLVPQGLSEAAEPLLVGG